MGLSNPSRETKFSGANADREKTYVPCSADHVQDWQSYIHEKYEKLGYSPNSNMQCKLGSLFLSRCVW